MGNKHKKEKKRHKRSHRRRSTSSSSSSSEEWVEKEEKGNVKKSGEDVMFMETCLSGKTKKELNEKALRPVDDSKERANVLDCPGRSDRELNPFWKNGGTGLPSENHDARQSSASRVGDNGVRWLRKALERAKEKSEEEGRSLDDVISERWGSLEKFNELLKNAEKNERKHTYDRKHFDNYSERSRYDSSKKVKNLNFRRPDDRRPDDDSQSRRFETIGNKNTRDESKKKNWRKPLPENYKKDSRSDETSSSQMRESLIKTDERVVSSKKYEDIKIFTINELNHLCAAVLRAELSGNKELAEKLESEVKLHKLRRKNALENKVICDQNADKVVILMETDAKGFTRPVKSLEKGFGGKRRAETHEGHKRLRYFADDDKYSLKDMFEREKYGSIEDDQSEFIKLVGKEREDDLDAEGVLDEARTKERKSDDRKQAQLIRQHIAQENAIEYCRWCVGSKTMLEECLVFSKSKVYVAVPTSQSLTERHCLIIPHSHVAMGTLLDEDVWDEIMELRTKIVQSLLKEEEDVIFFELATNLNKHPHMILHCVPVPKEIGDMAPLYFKKAMLECETEWTHNKKVIDLAGRGIRRAVPKGLPYFSVDFGMQSGYAHVIEDKKLFPTNFAQEIIGGMLDLDHSIWRKPRRDTADNIMNKVDLIKQLLVE